ncbi:hypothetical protein EBU99_09035 [bacterium]|nr:hypothetical protein [bacterium]
MMKSFLPIFFVFALGCRTGTPQSGSCTNSLSNQGFNANVEILQGVPAGGYVGFADRGCTATFSLISIDQETIKLNAYTASHCSRDDKPDNEKISIAVYLPPAAQSSGGYLKNLVAHDEFYERRAAFVSAVRALNNTRATFIAESLSKIPSFGVWWGYNMPSSTPPSPSQENLNRNMCLLKAKTDDTFKNSSYKNCWSVFDTGVRVLELKRAELGEKNFQILGNHLLKKFQEQKSIFEKSPQLAQQFNSWTAQIQGRMGAFRLLNYVKLAAFLNQDMCGKYIPSNSPDKVACAVRQNLIELGAKYLLETDSDGKRKNVFEKAQELGLPINSPIPIAEYDEPFNFVEFQDDMESRADRAFIENFNTTISSISNLLPVKNNVLAALPAGYSIATNISSNSPTGKSTGHYFGLVNFNSMANAPQGISAQGLSPYAGILKLYLNLPQVKLSFSKGDSGSMISIGGLVPLLALNTVNDEPTSGGASILALPEPTGDEEPVVAGGICK